MVKANTCYISCGCNRTPHCADWGSNGLVCYGACRAIAIAKIKEPSAIYCTLNGHTDRVNCVQWIRRQGGEPEGEFISGSTDATIRVWKKESRKEEELHRQSLCQKFVISAVLSGHTSSVNSVSAVYVPGEGCGDVKQPRTLIASASADSTVRIWERKENDEVFRCVKCLSLGSGFALDLTWTILPGTCVPVLAYGGDDTKIHLVVEESSDFHQVHCLTGHEDWIRALSFTIHDSGELFLASSSQDCFIRIWKVTPASQEQQQQPVALLAIDEEIKLKQNTFNITQKDNQLCYAVSLESVLLGHDNWVYSVQWKPPTWKDGKAQQEMCLLSASMDKTMILWQPDPESGVWIEKARVGDVGGNTLGFYGGVFSPDGSTILGHGYQGAFHVWHNKEEGQWEPGVPIGGHFDSVQDVFWEPRGGLYLMSASLDQTTRLHAYWPAHSHKSQASWHELSRPQVHGYDIQCLAAIDRYRFASGADEKVIRSFEAPLKFLENFAKLTDSNLDADIQTKRTIAPEGASVPSLGLSNKAVFQTDLDAMQDKNRERMSNSTKDQYPEFYFTAVEMNQPPSEDLLLQNTLWPEVQKLYGHGYEIFALAASPDGKYLASSCKAAKADHAHVILWDTDTWKQVCQLPGHSLTVTQLAFSHSGQYLLSVSRDRTWGLYRARQHEQPESDPPFSTVAWYDKKTGIHSRIIWACAWSHDDKYFATVSRDKKAVIWEFTGTTVITKLSHLELAHSITAVAFAPVLKENCYILAFGLEDGTICIYTWNSKVKDALCWTQKLVLQQDFAHHLMVKRLSFSPSLQDPSLPPEDTSKCLMLASCSDDHTVKICSINLDKL